MTVEELYQYCYKDGSEDYEIVCKVTDPDNKGYAEAGWLPEEAEVEIDDRLKYVILH